MSQIRFDEEVSNRFSMHYVSSRMSYNPMKYIDYVPDISGYIYIYVCIYIYIYIYIHGHGGP